MLYFPNAKINIGLNVISKREDGFHNLSTLFYPLQLCDGLEIVENGLDHTRFTQSGLTIEGELTDNLVYLALLLIKERFEIPNLDIHLHKKIPFGAGLGGGSADASFMLKALNEMFNLELNTQELIDLSVQLGSDCPFFIINTPCFATGRGEELVPTDLDLSGYRLVLVNPNIMVSTPEAFRYVTPHEPFTSLEEAILNPLPSWKGLVENDFEKSVFCQYPAIQELKTKLYQEGATYVSMSGSGSSVFGIFKNTVAWNREVIDPSYFVWEEIIK
ncbi:4-(cytidine 5'-diphospho)-2-C-methyl-D-erythritol kinase [Halosquirtibacter xylanolyticus]|uniref:4-(cytidine 5'-diphospho)-2-C-methyl-D-erythritol kinase n=1 Tax=Halosquirtibacter xylanolyticus TaxID=3374599 RepID=UPI003749EB60|nr:4-(cytidine 5'-diphospho)-2-C-methyl-D-erythritol kinase [Prolixibacteraceae bacterium]